VRAALSGMALEVFVSVYVILLASGVALFFLLRVRNK